MSVKAELMKSTVFDGAANSGFNNFVRIKRTISTPVARNPDIGYEEDGDLFGLGLNHKRDAVGGPEPPLVVVVVVVGGSQRTSSRV